MVRGRQFVLQSQCSVFIYLVALLVKTRVAQICSSRSVSMGLRPTKLDENGAGADSVLWSLRCPAGAPHGPPRTSGSSSDRSLREIADSTKRSLRQPRAISSRWFFDPAVLPRRKSRGPFSRECWIRAGSKEQVRATRKTSGPFSRECGITAGSKEQARTTCLPHSGRGPMDFLALR